MRCEVTKLQIVLVVGLLHVGIGLAAPKPADTPTDSRDKAVKEFVAKVYDALGKHDFDAFVELCDVPFNMQPNGFLKDKASIKKFFGNGPFVPPKFDGSKHAVRSIQTYKEAKPRFLELHVKDADAVITENDLVVHVVVNRGEGGVHHRLLITMKGGKPRLVGTQVETDDE